MSVIDNFNQLTLNGGDYFLASLVFATVLTGVGIYGKMHFPDPKKMAWIISIANSFISLIIGALYLSVKIPQAKGYFTYGDDGLTLFHNSDNVSSLTCLWFAMANIFDLAFGLAFYRAQIGLLTGYIHHTVYIWIMITSTTGNGFFLTVEPFAPAFIFMLIEEIPTFLLGYGSVFPQYRTDLGFGVTFFLLRIVYHSYMMSYAIVSKTATVIVVLYGLTLLLHLNWFYAWVTKYGKEFFKSKKSNKKSM